MGRHEGIPWKGDNVDALIRLYKKYRDVWDDTYGRRVRKLLKTVWEEAGKGKILVLGAGTPIRFPHELDEHITVVDRSERIIKELWKGEGRKPRFVQADITEDEDKIKKLIKGHDIIVLPAILSWLPDDKRRKLRCLLEEARKEGKTILAYDTTHMSTGYEGGRRAATQTLSDSWHDEYIGGKHLVLPVGVWIVLPRPIMSPAHLVDPGEEHFVEAAVHSENEQLLKRLRERLKPMAREGYEEAQEHSPELRRYVERKHSQWML